MKPLPTNKEIESLREEFYKFSFPNSDLTTGPNINEIAEWWLNKLHLLQENDRKVVEDELQKMRIKNADTRMAEGYNAAISDIHDFLSSNHN